MNFYYKTALFTLATFLVAGTVGLAQAPAANALVPQNVVVAQDDPLNNPEIKAAFEEATRQFTAANFTEAVETLKTAYEKFPMIMPPRVVMAQLFARSNVQQGVLPSLELATKETPSDPEAYLLLAEIALQQNALTSAELLLDKADTLNTAYKANPQRQKNMMLNSLRHRIRLYEARGDWENVTTHLSRMIEIQGESPTLTRQLAISLFQQKNDAKARELLHKTQGMPNDKGLPADAVLAQLYQRRGDMENARKSLDLAVQANPTSLEVHAMLVMMKLGDGALEEAKTAVEKLFAVDWQAAKDANRLDAANQPEVSINTKRLVATVALFRGEYTVAEQYFQEIIQTTPGDTASTNGLALALCEQTTTDAEGKIVPDAGKLQRALEYAVGNVQKHQNNREFLATLGWVFIKAGDSKRAIEVLKQACADGQMSPDTAFYLAKLSMDEGRAEQARSLLAPALANNQPFLKRAEAQTLLNTLPPPTPVASKPEGTVVQ